MELFDLLKEGASMLFNFQSIWLMIMGLILGIVAGALPGFTSTNALAVMLPLTLGMGLEGALVFMASAYCGSMYGDAVPAILFKTPGSPGAGATLIDGYPMTLMGMADRALGLSIGASIFGGVLAGLIVIVTLLPMAKIALRFGPAEMFLLALLGISVISSVSGKSIIKGLLAGVIGLLISAMSADPLWSKTRLAFGRIELFDEVPFIPVLIGLFAIPTLIELTQRKKIFDPSILGMDESAIKNIGNYSAQWKGVLEAFSRPITCIRSAIIGFFVGAIPGTGGSIATFISYGQAQLWSKNKDRDSFGKGNPDGVIASEACNNAVTGGAMVPLLALGIPGSTTTAIMLAALMLHGIVPGPQVIQYSPGPVYALLISLVVAPIFMFPLAMVFNRYSAMITTVSTSYIVPTLIAICIIGAYAVRLYVFDFYLVLIFGLLGILMIRSEYPVIPFVLGIILGPIAEGNVVRALKISRGDISTFYDSTLTIIIWILILLVLFLPVASRFFNKDKNVAT